LPERIRVLLRKSREEFLATCFGTYGDTLLFERILNAELCCEKEIGGMRNNLLVLRGRGFESLPVLLASCGLRHTSTIPPSQACSKSQGQRLLAPLKSHRRRCHLRCRGRSWGQLRLHRGSSL